MTNLFRRNHVLQGLVIWLVVLWVVTAINPLYPRDWLLENLLVFIYGALLVFTYRWFQFSNLSYALFTLFLSLHLPGAHYTYAETPFGFWLQEWFGFDRNHYDRIVHFSFGLLIAYPFQELLLRLSGIKRAWSYFIAINVIMAFSAVYEVIEGVTAMIVSPELGSAYLGTQGDEWDAQKDAFLAFMGAIIAMMVSWQLHKKRATI
ncbi:MAG: DUF2238 domain-containing protein [Gammaproteobacteria bacterium]|nr:DUF2238 domain-containing protein [Gammaproteobacteria bacterium]